MTQHELLAFVEGLHEHMKQETGKSYVVWPTREMMADNIRLNREFWGPGWSNQYRSALAEARRRHWVVIDDGCSQTCHAQHVRVTAAGAQALAIMNTDGCAKHEIKRRRGPCAAEGFAYTWKRAA
jgi:hypothetical protein